MVVLVAMRAGATILIGFHPEPGNYKVCLPPGESIEDGTEWDFHCPVCRASLRHEHHEKLAELAIDEGERGKRLLFSRVAGEHATYVITESEQAVSHGEHRQHYDDTVRIRLEKS
jgi:hypothetical protein